MKRLLFISRLKVSGGSVLGWPASLAAAGSVVCVSVTAVCEGSDTC